VAVPHDQDIGRDEFPEPGNRLQRAAVHDSTRSESKHDGFQ